ncbi:MAG TPA: IS1595 family transposase, partial [Roseiarcus sp.]|nr:IS1595 family transposase [Roseiarcus sp.]HEV7480014.1 IS1595 family transposase [Roseiarcus sp.]
HFPLFLKETEFRFNYGKPSQQLRTLKRWAKLKP